MKAAWFLPGVGRREILVDRVSSESRPLKAMSDELVECHDVAHRLGLRSTANDDVRSVETIEDRIEHLERAAPSRINPKALPLHCLDLSSGAHEALKRPRSRHEYLRMQASAEFILINPKHPEFLVTQGRILPDRLKYGAIDLGSIMIEEKRRESGGRVPHGRCGYATG